MVTEFGLRQPSALEHLFATTRSGIRSLVVKKYQVNSNDLLIMANNDETRVMPSNLLILLRTDNSNDASDQAHDMLHICANQNSTL